jgi:hydrogenase assembly chaperone HypC/HupF
MAVSGRLSGTTAVTLGPAPRPGNSRQLRHEQRTARRSNRHGGVTVCISAPGRVQAIEGDDAIVEMAGRTRRASLRMRADVVAGDWVLVGAGSVLRRLEPGEAAQIQSILDTAIASHDARPAATTTGGSR